MNEFHQHRQGCKYYFAPLDVCSCVERNMLDSEREANEILTAEIEALEQQVEAADRLAAWANAISERKASPTTGGRLILERDIVGLETALDAYEATKEKIE